MNLEVVIELTDFGHSSQATGVSDIVECARYIDPGNYDGVTWYFEIVGRNSHASNDYNAYLKDSAGSVIATITVSANTPASGNRQRFRSSSFAMGGADGYHLYLDQTAIDGDLTIETARVIAVQVGATKTCLPICMIGSSTVLVGPAPGSPISYIVGTTWSQQNADLFSIFRKDTSEFATIAGWRLDAVHRAFYGGGTDFSQVGLYNRTTGNMVNDSVVGNNTTAIVLSHVDFSDGAANFDNTDEFEIRHRNANGGDASYLFNACLYVILTSLSKASVYKRVMRWTEETNAHVWPFFRILGGFGAGSAFFEGVGRQPAGTINAYLVDDGSNEYGTGGSNIAASLINFTATKSRIRTTSFPVYGNRRYTQSTTGVGTIEFSQGSVVESIYGTRPDFWPALIRIL